MNVLEPSFIFKDCGRELHGFYLKNNLHAQILATKIFKCHFRPRT